MSIKNAKGRIYYGMHFYPGVAQYQEPGQEPYRVFLNEDTIRKMDGTFAGRPVYVRHVDEVNQNLDELRSEADGWVIESFYNQADGKHWVKFIACSEKAEDAIKQGWKLSNAYIPKSFAQGALWNGVPYSKEITSGEYEHLAIVADPRYEESVIMTPEKFKTYNENKMLELDRVANSKNEGESNMKVLEFFKRVKNESDLSGISVVLPKCGKEFTIEQLVNAMEEKEEKAKDMHQGLADLGHKVKMKDGSYCNVGELMEKHGSMNDELEKMKKANAEREEKEKELATKEESVEVEGDNKDKKSNDAEDGDKEEEKKKNESDAEAAAAAKVKADADAKEKADKLKNAHLTAVAAPAPKAEIMSDQVSRGRSRYGS